MFEYYILLCLFIMYYVCVLCELCLFTLNTVCTMSVFYMNYVFVLWVLYVLWVFHVLCVQCILCELCVICVPTAMQPLPNFVNSQLILKINSSKICYIFFYKYNCETFIIIVKTAYGRSQRSLQHSAFRG